MCELYLQPLMEPPDRADWETFVRYCKVTGKIFWRLNRSVSIRAEEEAGTVDHLGYVRLKLGKKKYLAHRVIWLLIHGTPPCLLLDHIDGNPNNNRIDNLREVSHKENMNNIKVGWGRHGLGVDFKNGAYYARIREEGKLRSLGRFSTAEEAQEAYLQAKSIRPGATLKPACIAISPLPKKISATGVKNIYHNKGGFQVKVGKACFGTHTTLAAAIVAKENIIKE